VKIALDSGASGGTHGLLITFLGPGFGETGVVSAGCGAAEYAVSVQRSLQDR